MCGSWCLPPSLFRVGLCLLTWIAVRSPDRDYEPLSVDNPPEEVAVRLTGVAGPLPVKLDLGSKRRRGHP